MLEKVTKKLTYTQIIALSVLLVILTGSFLLSLPVSSRDGTWTPYVNSLFTATTSTCVTGLVVYDTYTHWSIFGQIVILCLIQVGGLGFMTFVSMISLMLGKKIGLVKRRLIMESAGALDIAGVVTLIKRVIAGTFIFEGTGAAILTIRFLTKGMPFLQALYNGIFHSVSAFCNAGIDLFGKYGQYSSLTTFYNDPTIILTIGSLIVIGGIGFFVWNDVAKNGLAIRKYQLHTKAVLMVTFFLIVGGTIGFLILENDYAFAGMNSGEKLLSAIFQSITPRTAGYNSVDQAALSEGGSLFTMILMFIGGSPGSTAGGIKTTTFLVMILGAVSSARHSQGINIFKRRLEDNTVKRASAITTIYALAVLLSTIIICAIEPFSLKEIIFDVISAIGTVGLTMGITSHLAAISKLVLISLMYLGRVGGLSLALVLAEKHENVPINRPVDRIMVG